MTQTVLADNPLQNDTTLDPSKLEAFADNKFNVFNPFPNGKF